MAGAPSPPTAPASPASPATPAPGPGSSAPGTINCPTCRAANPASNKFCASCGASLVPSSPSQTPVDIRQRVDQDRGVLKRLQLLIPGFRGYRLGEDVREADSYLRLQIAGKVHNAVAVLQDCRQAMTNSGQFQALTDLAPVLSDLQILEGTIRHAEQGYSGISAALKVNPERLDRLYEYDYGFAQAADQVTATLTPLRTAAGSPDGTSTVQIVSNVRDQVRTLSQAFKARMNAIEGISI